MSFGVVHRCFEMQTGPGICLCDHCGALGTRTGLRGGNGRSPLEGKPPGCGGVCYAAVKTLFWGAEFLDYAQGFCSESQIRHKKE